MGQNEQYLLAVGLGYYNEIHFHGRSCIMYASCQYHGIISNFGAFVCRSLLFYWDFDILLHPYRFMMNTATTFLTCKRDHAFPGLLLKHLNESCAIRSLPILGCSDITMTCHNEG